MDSQKKEVLNTALILTDLIEGDDSVFSLIENFDFKKIDKAYQFIINNDKLSDIDKTRLIQQSWRIHYRAEPPTHENFISEKYLGPVAEATYDRIKKIFVDFLKPSEKRNLILYQSIGFGKALRNDTKIFTPSGYTLSGKIKEGDEVCTPNGKTSKVLKIFPQGQVDIYEFTFKDGRKTYASKDHLWKVSTGYKGKQWNPILKKYEMNEKSKEVVWNIKTTEEIIKSFKKNKIKIPLTKPVFHNKQEHYIPPYLMGALLGDGYFGYQITLTNTDSDCLSKIDNIIPDDLYFKKSYDIHYLFNMKKEFRGNKNPLKEEIKRLNLFGCKGESKFIPKSYLFDSIENRWELLRGLLDTDGTVDKGGRIRFDTTSEQLRDDIIFLIRSLGGLAHTKSYDRRSKKTNSICNYISHCVFISFPNNDNFLFYIKRKQDRVNYNFIRERSRRNTQYLYITDIQKVENSEATCILLDDEEHLYLTDDYIVTHNSFLSSLITIYIAIHLSLMRSPKRFFGLNPATVLAQLLVSYSLDKSSELLLEPMMNILEASPYFEKVRTKETMIKKEEEFKHLNEIDRIFWTTASPTSELAFSNGSNVKLSSTVHSLLGLAQPLDCKIKKPDGSFTIMGKLQIGDKIASPSEKETEVIGIYPQGKISCYEIELEDGRKTRCSLQHLWKVGYKISNDSEIITDIVNLKYILDHPEYEFFIYDEADCTIPEVPNATFKRTN